jgi:hypothetical protein
MQHPQVLIEAELLGPCRERAVNGDSVMLDPLKQGNNTASRRSASWTMPALARLPS